MKRRILSILLALCMTLALLPGTALAVDSGTCGLYGDNLTWQFNPSIGTLTISGTGPMKPFSPDSYCSGVHYPSSIPWNAYMKQIKHVVINEGVTSIGQSAFSSCENLISATIPDSVTAIQSYVFASCNNLSEIIIPDSVTFLGTSCFISCKSLTTITLPKHLTQILNSTFAGCDQLKSITIPAGVESIGTHPFNRCENLTEIKVDPGNSYYKSVDGVLFTKDGTTLIQYPAGKPGTKYNIPNGVITIGVGAFGSTYVDPSNCKLTSITIPNTVTTIEGWAFSHIDGLTSVTIPGSVEKMGHAVFQSCKNLTDVTFQENIKEISDYMFNYCTKLTNVTLPSSITKIYDGAFNKCPNLKTINFAGTKTQWDAIDIDSKGNDPLASANINYNFTTPTIKIYTITLNANGGMMSQNIPQTSINVEANTAYYSKLPTPTRTGYTFSGWYTAQTGGTKITSSSKATGNTTLYAHWTPIPVKTYTITLNANGGKVSQSSVKVEANKTYYSKLPAPTRTGYKFNGWYTAKTGGTKITTSTKATKNLTLYAHWTKQETDPTGIVTFNANGGTVLQRCKAVLRGTRYRDLPTPTRPGYHFQGWYTKPTGGTKVLKTTYVTTAGDHTLYARWTKTAPTVRTTKPGSYTVYIPPYYKLPLYATNITATQAKVNPAQTIEYAIKCTKMVTLSNGTTRYYGKVGGVNRWFQFTCEMDVG